MEERFWQISSVFNMYDVFTSLFLGIIFLILNYVFLPEETISICAIS